MDNLIGVLLACGFGAFPLFGMLLWWWNEILYALPVKFRLSGTGLKLPPGHMGLPFLGEMLNFIWFFKILRRPDDFINSKRTKYGDGVGLYRSHLFGSPSIIAIFPSTNKFVLQSDDKFMLGWPTAKLVGLHSMLTVHGKAHTRLRNFVTNAINRPNALRRIATLVQPRIVASLESWVQKGKINAKEETKKVTFENIGKFFASLEPGPELDAMDKLFKGLLQGLRVHPLDFPGTTYHSALQCRKILDKIFREMLEKKKNQQNRAETMNDLMDGLMRVEDEEGNQMSDQEVIDNIINLVVAGYESTALASMWAVYHLGKNPNVLQKLREENMALREKTEGAFITSDDVSKLIYTNKVVEETIRMANIAPTIFREAIKETEYKGYIIPKNWKVICWVRYLHTDHKNFDDPMCFNPDRWNENARPGAYLVFGGGSRICAGNMLARLQLALFLHHLSTGYKWTLLNPDADMIYLSHPSPTDGVEAIFSKI